MSMDSQRTLLSISPYEIRTLHDLPMLVLCVCVPYPCVNIVWCDFAGDTWACVKRWGSFSRWNMYDLQNNHLAQKRREAIFRRSG